MCVGLKLGAVENASLGGSEVREGLLSPAEADKGGVGGAEDNAADESGGDHAVQDALGDERCRRKLRFEPSV